MSARKATRDKERKMDGSALRGLLLALTLLTISPLSIEAKHHRENKMPSLNLNTHRTREALGQAMDLYLQDSRVEDESCVRML